MKPHLLATIVDDELGGLWGAETQQAISRTVHTREKKVDSTTLPVQRDAELVEKAVYSFCRIGLENGAL